MGENRKEAQFRKMTGERIPGLILSLAVPTIISMIVTAIYNTADTYFVSKLGTSASGAVGIVMSLMGLIQSLGFMIGMGSGSWMSRLLGEKKDETASKVAASGFYFSLVLGLLVAVMGCCFLDPLVGLLGATETIRPYAREYAQYILYASPFLIASFTMNKMLWRKARTPMISIVWRVPEHVSGSDLHFPAEARNRRCSDCDRFESDCGILHFALHVCERTHDRRPAVEKCIAAHRYVRPDYRIRPAVLFPAGSGKCGDDRSELDGGRLRRCGGIGNGDCQQGFYAFFRTHRLLGRAISR